MPVKACYGTVSRRRQVAFTQSSAHHMLGALLRGWEPSSPEALRQEQVLLLRRVDHLLGKTRVDLRAAGHASDPMRNNLLTVRVANVRFWCSEAQASRGYPLVRMTSTAFAKARCRTA